MKPENLASSQLDLAVQPISGDVLAEKYLKPGESSQE